MCLYGLYVCVSFPTYQTTVGCRFHKFSPLSIKHSPSPYCFFTRPYIRPHLSLPPCLLLHLSGIQGPKLLSLWLITSRVTSSMSLTLRVRAALGKCRLTDLPIRGMLELRRGQQGLALLHYPTN